MACLTSPSMVGAYSPRATRRITTYRCSGRGPRRAGANDVRFTQSVILYVQNFLHFPVGGIVPAGYYNRARGLWVPSENGRIVQVVAVSGGVAALDVDGDGTADEGAALTELGITDAERHHLAPLY